MRTSACAEYQRLITELPLEHPTMVAFRTRLQDREAYIAATRQQLAAATLEAAVLEGIVRDGSKEPRPNLIVSIESDGLQPAPQARTNELGSYHHSLTAESVKALQAGTSPAMVIVRDASTNILAREKLPTLKLGTAVVIDFIISTPVKPDGGGGSNPTPETSIPLSKLTDLDDRTQKRLIEAGIPDCQALAKAKPEDLQPILGENTERLQKQAARLVQEAGGN